MRDADEVGRHGETCCDHYTRSVQILAAEKVVHLDSFGGAELNHMSITERGRAGRLRTSEDITMWACRDIRSSTHIKDERRMMLGENTLLTRAVSAIRPSRWR